MTNETFFTDLHDAISATQQVYYRIASGKLGTSPEDIESFLTEALKTIHLCADAGWKIGKIWNPGVGAIGQIVGMVLGLSIVVAGAVYHFMIIKTEKGLRLVPS